ncbi:MAG: type IV toxin-antitoxin system AbiEi family antitoxin domain-containing protein [Akkermansiaceae bacterium]|jgi:predicted transcriptional regulator of viral defense system|nr:type IV toxin-antitoxin system AbiEi family antitoxin domain-containing protein [Akkermansiaceae bacterium]
MAVKFTQFEKLMELAGNRPLLKASDVRAAGVSSSILSRALRDGALEQVTRGLYRRPDAPWDEHLMLSEVSARVPQAIIVLVSALNFHQIGSHQAHAVTILLKQNAVTPRIEYPALEVIRSTKPGAFTDGVERHVLNGIEVKITTPARTVADCFKHRNKLGLELCLEALKEILRSGKMPAEIMNHARMNRVEKVMMPYLEALL